MRVLIVPDVHLKTWMYDSADNVIARYQPEKIVCLGDIADDFGHANDQEAYYETFDRAERFAKDHPDALWCWGNHDISYMWGRLQSGTAGAARDAAVRCILSLEKKIAPENLAFVHRIDDVLFSHAGITRWFVKEYIPDTKNRSDPDAVIRCINEMHAQDLWTDLSPIWARPQADYEGDAISMYLPDTFLQVVGHSPMKRITWEKTDTKNILSCDVFSTYRDGTPYGSEEFCLLDTKTCKWQGVK